MAKRSRPYKGGSNRPARSRRRGTGASKWPGGIDRQTMIDMLNMAPYVIDAARNVYSQPVQTSSARARTVRRGKRFRTVGRYRGKFKKTRRYKSPKYEAGCIVNREVNGVVDNTGFLLNPVVIGHTSCPQGDMCYTVAGAIIKTCLKMIGITSVEWFQQLGQATTFDVYYERAGSEVVTNRTFVNTQSYNDVVAELKAVFEALLVEDNIKKINFKLGFDQTEIYMTDYRFHFYCKSVLKLQNRTLASATAGNNDADNAMNVTNNPVIGRKYRVKGPAFVATKVYGPQNVNFVSDSTTGVITKDWTGTNGDDLRAMRHPISPSMFRGKVHIRGCRLQPGDIKHDILKSQFSFKFFDWFQWFKASTVNYDDTYGHSNMFWFEKELETLVDEPVISVGYQKDYRIGCVATRVLAYSRPVNFP